MNAERFRDRGRITDRVRNGKNLWDRAGEEYDMIDSSVDVPRLLFDKPDRFRYLLDWDGESAGFADYRP
ncbi:hypothetical protein QBC33DRAFT_530972 [Phialemonium atrogriseum]|uniref:Uncharacterized protein n=1 Tax=Phialemonium atrogriseum TaxID=1093897 RepID=A0AAJ0C4S7_9PEZI|nr:uncharacterized protein QBC33DRAFT_530972 [Phialemonium atrogriseum]KAK1769502.1 hypothetical protein QBC33DRAFT_530972 [Phialemonium atrogriseum]